MYEPLDEVGGVTWFESAYDAMAFYQIHREAIRQHPELSRNGIYVSTGGSPTRGQIKGMLEATPQANHYLCFDNDKAGRGFVELFRHIADELHIEPERVRIMPMPVWAKDWNDVQFIRVLRQLHFVSVQTDNQHQTNQRCHH